nr:protein hunchback-like [Cherax quadricarinatus]
MMQETNLADIFPTQSPTMSADCEAVPAQPLPTGTLPATSPITATGTPPECHGPSDISYEGRVSALTPLGGYEGSARTAMELDQAHMTSINDASHVRKSYLQENSVVKEEPMNISIEHDMEDTSGIKIIPHFEEHTIIKEHCNRPTDPYTAGPQSNFPADNVYTPRQLSPTAGHSQEGTIKESKQVEKCQSNPQERKVGDRLNDSDTLLCFAPPDHSDPMRSPIEKAGESPDLPTNSARTPSGEEPDQSFNVYDHSYGKVESIERMSPYDEIYQENEQHLPSSIEPDSDDTTESSMMHSDMDHLSRLQYVMKLSGVMSGNEGEAGDKSQVFQCHICSYSGTSRFHFSVHVNTHYDHKCAKCDFTAHTESKMREHMQEEHDIKLDSNEDLESIRVPRVNSQGKVKTFKCKQCEYVAITKSDFWEHARSHIKSEKLLACSKCPFVTEYKHHLEYHLRNHFGSKPFKCNKCKYSCVNKSMLNSHMKSHSNIYQYRCSDCTYATKYCHSLKLHLRKYGHNPAMVLNPDGTPNPIPIIDVYGTRRGPKLKKDDKGMPILPPNYQNHAQILKAQMHVTRKIPSSPTSPLDSPQVPGVRQPGSVPPLSCTRPPYSLFSYTYPNMIENLQSTSPILSHTLEKSSEDLPHSLEDHEHLRELLLERERAACINPLSPEDILRCSICDFITDRRELFSQHMMVHERREDRNDTLGSPQTNEHSMTPERRSSSPVRPPMLPHQRLPFTNTEMGPMYSPLAAAHNLKEYLTHMNPFIYQHIVSRQIHPAFGLQQHLQHFVQPALQDPQPFPPQEEPRQPSPQSSIVQILSPNNDGVLDLSKEQTLLQQTSMASELTPPQQIRDTSQEPPPLHQRNESRSSLSPDHLSPPLSETSTPPLKNRRKGRAFKLERITLRLSESAEGESSGHDEDIRKEREESHSKTCENRMPSLVPLAQHGATQETWRAAHHCQFCDMAFKDVVMYTMHMGYHGYHNPFTCNKCGHQAMDKVAFFLHVARSSHS